MLDIKGLFDNLNSKQHNIAIIYNKYEFDEVSNFNYPDERYTGYTVIQLSFIEDLCLKEDHISFKHGNLVVKIYSNNRLIDNNYLHQSDFHYVSNIQYYNSKIQALLDSGKHDSIKTCYIDEEHGKKYLFLSDIKDIKVKHDKFVNIFIKFSFKCHNDLYLIQEFLNTGNLSMERYGQEHHYDGMPDCDSYKLLSLEGIVIPAN